MKKALFIFATFLLLNAVSGCGDGCRKIDCENDGFCRDGECFCQKWFSGETCELKFNRNYSGTYYGTLKSDELLLMRLTDSIRMDAAEEPNRLWCNLGFAVDFMTDSTFIIHNDVEDYSMDTIEVNVEGNGKYDVNWIEFTGRRYDLDGNFLSEFSFTGEKVEK